MHAFTTRRPRAAISAVAVVVTALALVPACADDPLTFDAREPARGPGVLAGHDAPLNALADLVPRDDTAPGPRAVPPPAGATLPDCDAACRAHCDAADLANPVNRAVCPSLWGAGLDTRPIDPVEACRRLHADVIGRLPTADDVRDTCAGRAWSDVVASLLATDDFVRVERRRWADRLLYNNEALSPARIYDMDLLVDKLYRGLVDWQTFAAVVSAHPVLTRRNSTAADRAEAFFSLFVGRPPFEHERADLARLYALWDNGYDDHPALGRLPDAYVRFRCVTDAGDPDPDSLGECTSVLWGYHTLVLRPDLRATDDGRLWSGLLTADEWALLTLPGRIVATLPVFWERAVDQVLTQYLGYDLAASVPAVRDALVDTLIAAGGDIRAVHAAVLTSRVYLQSAAPDAASAPPPDDAPPPAFRWTWGPLKQTDVETWLDTVAHATDVDLGACDFRLPDPDRLRNLGTPGAYALLTASDWPLAGDRVDTTYRDLARDLGGCPENLAGGRFQTISILTTALQEGVVTALCNPSLLDDDGDVAPVRALLPDHLTARSELDDAVASDVLRHQTRAILGREPTLDETQAARAGAAECAPKPCTAEAFARPLCWAVLTSAELLFY